MHCASQWPQKVKALAPIHPAPGAPATTIYMPMMVPTGALDFVTSPMLIKTAVYDGSPSPKVMPIMNGVQHREPVDYAGASRWNGYLTAFFSLYLKQDLKAALLIWGDETGSLSKDIRISVAHKNKGSILTLEKKEADIAYGKSITIKGKLTKTLPLTHTAQYVFKAFKRIEKGFEVAATFEIIAIEKNVVDFAIHITGNGRDSPLGATDKQKITILALNIQDGGTSAFANIHLTLDPNSVSTDEKDISETYQEYYWQWPSVPNSKYFQGDKDQVAAFSSPPPSLPKQPNGFWAAPPAVSGKALGDASNEEPTSGTTYTTIDDKGLKSGNSPTESWADIMYSTSKNAQHESRKLSSESLKDGLLSHKQNRNFSQSQNPADLAKKFLSGRGPSKPPSSLMPWTSIGKAFEEDNSIVLGVSDHPVGYGDAKNGQPPYQERHMMMWINTVRSSPQRFKGAYLTRGCKFEGFENHARVPQVPLHFNQTLSHTASDHSTDMAGNDFVSHIGSDNRTPFERLEKRGYTDGYRGENIAAGMKYPFDAVISWMCSKAHRENLMSNTFKEMGIGFSSNLATQYKNYWTLNLGHSGLVNSGKFDSSFVGEDLRSIAIGLHHPEEPIDEVSFTADFYDPRRSPPSSVSVFANGIEFPLVLKYGESHHGIYEKRIQLLSIPMWQIMASSSPCIVYHFKALRKDGHTSTFPELGSYGFGGCAFDDTGAKWLNFQNETVTGLFETDAKNDNSMGRTELSYDIIGSDWEYADTDIVCLTDVHICADNTIARREPPSCQFHCESGDALKKSSEFDFLESNKQNSVGSLQTCASTWGQFWSGVWNWCTEVLDEAWNDPQNPWRVLIPLWREVQKVDWVAAANAMTEFWQNMQQCKTYKPLERPTFNLMSDIKRSSIRIGQGQAIQNMQRVIVRSHIKHERLTSAKLYLKHRVIVNKVVVEKSILLGNISKIAGEVIFDDFAEAPMPGWWGSWFETFAVTAWNSISNTIPDTKRFAMVNGKSVPVVIPEEALIHFLGSSGSSSAGIWDLIVSHDDPVQTALINSWDLMICGEPMSKSLNFSSETYECTGDKDTHYNPFCQNSLDCTEQSLHLCGSVSTVGGYSTQPPASSNDFTAGSILRIGDTMHIQPLSGHSMYCSNVPLVQEAWVKPRYDSSGLEIALYLFHHSDPENNVGAWKLVAHDSMDIETGKMHAQVSSGVPASGCWIWYTVSKKGAGPYDFWMASSPS